MSYLGKGLLNNLFKLYSNYKSKPQLSAWEFIEQSGPSKDVQEIGLFLDAAKHQQLLQCLVAQGLTSYGRINRTHAEVLLYLLIFVLNDDNWESILDYCIQRKFFYLCDLIASVADSSQHLNLCQTACRYFDNDYVLNNILDPFLEKVPLIINLGTKFFQHYQVQPAPVTKPMEFSFAGAFYAKHPFPPSNTPVCQQRFKACDPPESTWKKQASLEKAFEKAKLQNRKRAEQLLLEAAQVPERLTKPPPVVDDETCLNKSFKSKKPPALQNVSVKSNTTTTLREAARIAKKVQEETKKVDDLIRGGCGRENVEKLEQELRRELQLKEMETIERNHLKGLLSYEESILAKQRLLQSNKLKMEQFKEDKAAVLKTLEAWREAEELKMRSLVEKAQAIKRGAKDTERKLIEQKQADVRQQQQETRLMLQQAWIEKQKELARKIELIQEIKAVHRVRCQFKEFDPTDTPNLGLLCEMSIAELQERLVITRINMKQELEEKRLSILRRKEAHKTMLENVRKVIEQNRATKNVEELPVGKDVLKKELVLNEPGLVELRKKLEEKRRLRQNTCLV